MPESLEKLRPDRDLQCYFERPSAIAALSAASPSGFTVSGTWRQPFDWAVIEWNRDNVFEHPALRNLPDGDLSGLTLTYDEIRVNCIPIDSNLYPTVDWPYLRVWTEDGGFYQVPLTGTPAEGAYAHASASFTLTGTPTPGDYIELAWEQEHYTYQLLGADTLDTAAQALCDSINAFSPAMRATSTGATINLVYEARHGDRIGVYGNVAGVKTESWSPGSQRLTGGTAPSKWRVQIPFGALVDRLGRSVPTNRVRKLRWTYAAALQTGHFQRSEFEVRVSNWTVTGSGRAYSVAGAGGRRLEDDGPEVTYSGAWTVERGNYSGSSIHRCASAGAVATCRYRHDRPHQLYAGLRLLAGGAGVSVAIDGGAPVVRSLHMAGEDVLLRVPLGSAAPGQHTVTITNTDGGVLYFDFLEIAHPTTDLPSFAAKPELNLATDWDTDHSLAIAPERTAWLIHKLGYTGRANHYVGALVFYELARPGHQYASATVAFSGLPEFSQWTYLGVSVGGGAPTTYSHLNLIGDTAASIAKAFEFLINNGSTAIWAEASGAVLTVWSRLPGVAGNQIGLTPSTGDPNFTAEVSGPALTGGADGEWRTDLAATPRLNRAVRDWSRSFFLALKNYGIEVTSAFSMELQHGDPSWEAGVAQRYPDGSPALLNTPALQTNFSPASTAYWRQVYLEMAALMHEAGVTPYLQFGEVQWWYFPSGGGMPFYDAYTVSEFAARYGRAMHVFTTNTADPAQHPEEAAFLPGLIGEFTDAVMTFVRQSFPNAKFEVLYPPDVNDFSLTRVINLPLAAWSQAKLDNLKTENFTYTGNRDLNKARESVLMPMQLGFPRAKSSHLVGIWDATCPWEREMRMAQGERVESVTLFALDQFCLVGYPPDGALRLARSSYQG